MDDLTGYVSDDELAIEPLRKLGWAVETISWRDRSVDWNDFALVILRTTWDYQQFPNDFFAALERIEASRTILQNSLEIVRWNLNKLYLRELEEKGVRIVPTIWDQPTPTKAAFEDWKRSLGTDEIIIKPYISATAEHTYRLKDFDEQLPEIFGTRPFMVQPFMPNIVAEGEFSLFYFSGVYSHTILKSPKEADFRVQEEHGGLITEVSPTNKMKQTAESILGLIPETPLYARIDLVRDDSDEFCLMELELIEPALYLRMNENAAGIFAETVDSFLKAAMMD